MRTKIWKLQRPQHAAGNLNWWTVLAYTKGKKDMQVIGVLEEQLEDIFGDEDKIYAKCQVIDGILHVNEQVENQDW